MRHRLTDQLQEAVLPSGGNIYVRGATVPTDGTSGYAKGCIFIQTDGGAGTTWYLNEGTYASCDFNAPTATVGNDVDLGGAAAAGSLDVFSGAGTDRKIRIVAADTGANSRVLTITNEALAASRTVKVPDPGGDGQFVVTTADNTVTINANGSDRTVSLAGNVALAGGLTTAAAVTFSGAFAAEIAVPSASTWTLPAGGGTLAVATGAETGTSSNTFEVNNDGNSVTISSAGQTSDHVFTFPDATGVVVTEGATQTLTAKTLASPAISGGALTLSAGTTVTGTWADLGVVTTVDINGGTVDNAAIGASTPSTGAFTSVTVGGGYGDTGVTISAAGVLQANGAITTDGALTAGSAVIGGGYGDSGCTISAAGVIQANGAITTDGALTAASAVIGGGFGSTGCTISDAGVIQADGALTCATVNAVDATTPAITTATGKTNTGYLQVNGKTSGGIKITCADAAVALLTVSAAAQTDPQTLTIPDTAGAGKYTAFGDSSGNTAVANLAAAVQDLMPSLTITAGEEAAHARTITIQMTDAAGNSLAERHVVRFAVNAAAEYGAPSATASDTFGAPSAGAIFETITAKAFYEVVTDATGKYVFALTHNDAGTSRYITAWAGTKAISSGEITFDAV